MKLRIESRELPGVINRCKRVLDRMGYMADPEQSTDHMIVAGNKHDPYRTLHLKFNSRFGFVTVTLFSSCQEEASGLFVNDLIAESKFAKLFDEESSRWFDNAFRLTFSDYANSAY